MRWFAVSWTRDYRRLDVRSDGARCEELLDRFEFGIFRHRMARLALLRYRRALWDGGILRGGYGKREGSVALVCLGIPKE